MTGSRLFFAIVFGFLIGVFVRSFVPLGFSYAVFLALLACAAMLFGYIEKRDMRVCAIMAAACIACACGMLRMQAAILKGDPHMTRLLNHEVVLLGVVSKEPDLRENGTLVQIDATSLVSGTTSIRVQTRVLAEAPLHTSVEYGDAVEVSGEIVLPLPFDTTDGKQFDYPDYVGASGIGYQLMRAQIKVTGANVGNPLVRSVLRIKKWYLNGLADVLPEPESGLAAGITVGDKRSIGPELSTDFQKVGLMQMVVLSGYNITVVVTFFAKLLAAAPQGARFGSGLAVVLFFIVISGGSSSAVRAGLMAAIALYASYARRRFEVLRALGFAALLMVMWNPFTLAFDPGFQLSGLSIIGLGLLAPLFDAKLLWIPAKFHLREIISSTLAAQSAVLPLLLFESGQLTIFALPANVLAMIPVPLAMLASCFAALSGILLGTHGAVAAYPAYLLLSYIIAVGRFFASIPFSSISIGAFNAIDLCLSYAVLFGTYLFFKSKTAPSGSRLQKVSHR